MTQVSVSEKVRAMSKADREALVANLTKMQKLCMRKIELLSQLKRAFEREWRKADEE